MPSNMFLKIKSISGSSKVEGMENTIEVLSFSFSGVLPTSNAASAAAETHGHAHISDFQVTKNPDKASPFLLANMLGGQRMTEDVEFDVNKIIGGKSQTFITIKLTGALVSSMNMGGGAGQELPTESVTFSFTKVVYGFADEAAGKVAAPVNKGWDVVASKPI